MVDAWTRESERDERSSRYQRSVITASDAVRQEELSATSQGRVVGLVGRGFQDTVKYDQWCIL